MSIHSNRWSLFRLSDRVQFDHLSQATVDFFFRASSESVRADWLMWREGFSGWRPLGELAQILKHLEETNTPTPPPVPDFESPVTSSLLIEDNGVGGSHAEEPFSQTHSSVSNRAIAALTSSSRSKTLRLETSPKTPVPASSNANARPTVPVLTLDEATLSLQLESQANVDDRDNTRYPKKFRVRIFAPKGILALVTLDCSTTGFRLKEALPEGMPRFFNVEMDLGPDGKIPMICSEVQDKDGRGVTRVRIQVNDHSNTLKSALMKAA